ncbi:MAG: coproporphyrinogen III oxidase, partial [Gammaproteobacteria bacterium]
LSMYQLTIEKGTKFYSDFSAKKFQLPKDDLSAQMYEFVEYKLAAQGFKAYEVSNYAQNGSECRHNMGYWQYQDYLGIGAGAHGRITRDKKIATMMIHSPENWLQAVNEKGVGLQTYTELTEKEVHEERLMMGLRLVGGVSKHLVNNLEKLNEFKALGLLEEDAGKVRTTLAGRMLLNKIVFELLT